MFIKRNPKKNLIKDLRNSEELYSKLKAISKYDTKLKNRAQRHIEYIDDFIFYIESLSADELRELLKDC